MLKALVEGILSMNIAGRWPARFVPRRAVLPPREQLFEDMRSAMENDFKVVFRSMEDSIGIESKIE